jgi:hypothetical protein
MKIIFNPNDGTILQCLRDADALWLPADNGTALTLVIEEIPANVDLMWDLLAYGQMNRFDSQGRQKYYVEGGELYEVDDWKEEAGWLKLQFTKLIPQSETDARSV